MSDDLHSCDGIEAVPTTSDTSLTFTKQRRSSFAEMMKFPRRSLNTIKERLTNNVRGSNLAKKRHSRSDTALLRPTRSISARVTRSIASTKSVVNDMTLAVPLTKWSRKLYGSEKAVQDEHLKLLEAGRFIIHPFSNFRFTWDLLSAILIVINIIVIPMDLAFSGPKPHVANQVFKVVSDMWFLIDILLNFRTGIPTHGKDNTTIVLNPRKIAKKYLCSWFITDFIAAFPFDFFLSMLYQDNTAKAVRSLRSVKVVSLFRVARLPRLVRGLHHWEEIFNLQYDMAVSLLRLAYLIFIIFMACHWNGCLQYMIPMFFDYPEDTWVAMRGLHHPNVTWWEAYSWSLFKSTSQMLCLGYSVVIPVGLIDLWVTQLSQITGAVLFGIFISNAINLMEEMDAVKHAYKARVSQIQEYLAFRRIPLKMRRVILDYFEVRYGGKIFDEKQILSELSPALRREVILFNTSDLIHSVPLFDDVSEDFVADLGEVLAFTVYTPDAVVVKEAEIAFHMFFIIRGELTITASDGSFMREISDGMHFGETCLLNQGLRRAASVNAITNVHMYTLHRADFKRVADRHPDDKHRIETRFSKLQERSSQYDFIKRFESKQNV